MPKNGEDWGKLIVAKGFKKLPIVQNIAQSGHTTVPPHIPWIGQGGGILLFHFSMIYVSGHFWFKREQINSSLAVARLKS